MINSVANRQNACVAQLVEQRIRNAQVIGSSPITSSKKPRNFMFRGFAVNWLKAGLQKAPLSFGKVKK